jgi:hypothetical protein
MTRARDTSRVQIGINTAVSGADEFTYVPKTALIVSENIDFNSSNSGAEESIITLERTHMNVSSGTSVTIGSGKHLIINPSNLPHTVS